MAVRRTYSDVLQSAPAPSPLTTPIKRSSDFSPNTPDTKESKPIASSSTIDVIKPSAPSDDEVYMFVDNSNFWITAKQLASEMSGFITKEDHRVRLDIGQLTDVIANGRKEKSGCLYGSEPPKVDSVWQKIEEKGWKTDIRERSLCTGSEKEVDGAICTHITRTVCKISPPGTIIIVSGDGDFRPAIQEALIEGWRVEVYSWEKAMADRIKKLPDERVQIHYLDQFLDRITFVNRKYMYNTEQKFPPYTKAVALHMRHNFFTDHVPSDEWCHKIEQVSQWPFQYVWKGHSNLVLVFKGSAENVFDLQSFVKEIKEYPLRGVISVDVYHDDRTLPKKRSDSSTKRLRCQRKYCCQYGVKCHYEHTIKEEKFFERNKGIGLPYEKVEPCHYYYTGNCNRKYCKFAHGEKDALCPNCSKGGHYEQYCPLRQ